MSWENFSKAIVVEDEQRTYRVSESPRIDFFWDGQRKCVGFLLETAADTVLAPELVKLAFIAMDVIRRGNVHYLKITTTSTALRRQFYHFAVAVSERLLSERRNALDAVTTELECFDDLLAERPVLSRERQVGLLGELLFLDRLIQSCGMQMLDSWVGPENDPHDFRFDMREFEVKTTITARRIHIINGTEQLIASKDCRLFILSIVLGPPDGLNSSSFSLADKVRDVESRLIVDSTRRRRFNEALETVGLRIPDLVHYERKYSLRRPLAVVPIDSEFPALTRATIQKAFGRSSQRIESIQYVLNVEGLEHEEGTSEFSNAIPISNGL
jgi:hypothetical protein